MNAEERRPVGQAVDEVMRELGFGREMTDAEWEAHDAKVMLARERAANAESVDREKRRYIAAGYPARAVEHAWNADVTRPGIERVATWHHQRQHARSVLVLSGTKGSGKTVAATWWARQSGLMPVYLRCATFAATSRYDREQRNPWLGAKALILDDLGAEYSDPKGSFLVDLDELVDAFYGGMRPMVVTTNCTAAEFRARFGERVVDRFRECCTWASLGGESLRPKPRGTTPPGKAGAP